MCIAILNVKGTLEKSVFQNSFDNNPDGIGIAWIENGKIQIKKSMTSYSTIYKKYKKVRKQNSLPIMIHSRIGTHGIKNIDNCHPFTINSRTAFCHNGVLSIGTWNEKESDTVTAVRYFKALKKPFSLFNPESIEYHMADAICGTSKFIFLHTTGKYQIINESKGHWINDTWYSNDSYLETDYFYVGNKKVTKNGKACSANYNNGYGNSYSYHYEWVDWPAKKSDTKQAKQVPAVTDTGDIVKRLRSFKSSTYYKTCANVIEMADSLDLWKDCSAIRPFVIPDVTHELKLLMQYLSHEYYGNVKELQTFEELEDLLTELFIQESI